MKVFVQYKNFSSRTSSKAKQSIPEPPVDQDGKYIHFKVIVGGDAVITVRDSLRLLPQGLEKLCKEIDVEHTNFAETVCHNNDITVEN